MIAFFIKKIFKSFGNISVLLAIVIIPLFCLVLGSKINIPNIGYMVDEEALKNSEVSYIIDELKNDNYIKYVDREKMFSDIDNSIIDAGVVIKNDFVQKMKNNDIEGIIEFLTSESSFFSDIRKIEVLSKFMTVYAPYITYDTIRRIDKGMYEKEYSLDKIKMSYNDFYNDDTSVIVNIEKVEGEKLIENKSEIYFKVSLIFLVIITMVFFVIFDSINCTKKMKNRFPKIICFKKIFIPLFVLKILIVCLFVSITFFLKPIVANHFMI